MSRITSASRRTSATPTAAQGRNTVSRMSVHPETRMTVYEQSAMGSMYAVFMYQIRSPVFCYISSN